MRSMLLNDMMCTRMKKTKISQKLYDLLGSKKFFFVVVGIFLISASWLALTSRYPMAFDENYHYGIIQQYANQWSPFFSNAPAGSESLGDITRYPSYVFHYLMSFPYRLVSIFTDSDTVKIIILRFMNIAMLASSLWIFKRIFEEAKISKTVGNIALFVYVLVPVVPFLGAQISYDNASIPLTALTVLLALRIITKLRDRTLDTNLILAFGVLGTLSSLVKYTYLPIFGVAALYVLVAIIYYCRKYKLAVFAPIIKNLTALTPLKRALLIVLLILGLGLFVERYGINMIKYHTPVPDCGQILSESSCKQYGPWGRDLRLKQRRLTPTPQWKISDYNRIWVNTTMHEFFFAIDHNYTPKPPLAVLYKFANIMVRLGLILSLVFIWKWFKNYRLRFFAILFVSYVAVVWADNFSKFYSVHWPVAIHGRYLLPLLPLALVVIGYSLKYLLDFVPRFKLHAKLSMAIMGMLFMAYGGGALTYIIRSDSTWYWQNNIVIKANTTVKKILEPVIK